MTRLEKELQTGAVAPHEVDAALTSKEPSEQSESAASNVAEAELKVVSKDGVVHVRHHLVVSRWEPNVSNDLDVFDRNLAGKSLLPHLEPFDWPEARELLSTSADTDTRTVEAGTARSGMRDSGHQVVGA